MNDKTASGRPEPGDALLEQLNGDVQALAAAVEQLAQRLRIRSGTPSRIIALEQQLLGAGGGRQPAPGDGPGRVALMIRQPTRGVFHNPPIHRPLVHRPAGGAVAATEAGGHTGGMSDSRTLQSWATRLNTTAATLSDDPTVSSVHEAMTLAWHTAKRVGQPVSPATALGWMRLAESLVEAWSDLTALADPPGPIPFDLGTPADTGALEDAPQLRGLVAHLLRATATAARELCDAADHRDADAALALAIIASTLDDAAQDWP